ncbi:MAG: PAS domain-containing sensor histidine kinase [Candidatus Accumulibacter sp.]|jgi:two-component system sensor histidine kinase PilS (NtrC family)|nr:PAS domain-containing sensor histidine kinase [Accumulibacter sp.]
MPDAIVPRISPIHWKTLRYFSAYRLCVAALLVISSFYQIPVLSLIGQEHVSYQSVIAVFYFLANAASLAALYFYRRRFNRQLSIQVLLDVLVLTWLAYAAGGLRDSLGIMLLVTLAGAGLLGQGRLALFYAALATLAVLAEESLRLLHSMYSTGAFVDFFQAGLFCAGSFIVAISARLLASRVIANEELARRRGEALRNQMIINQHAIEEMQDGVLVLDREGNIKQHNPRIEQLLGLGNPEERKLSAYSTELALGFGNWAVRGGDEPVLIRAPASGIHLRVRFIATESSEGDVLVLIEDLGRLQEQARQLKLAALGRLTANIAHEIRNPLSAIKHAGELMREESTDPTSDRLLRIVLDNTQRVERIVSDVLELGRRDRAHREFIDLSQTLPLFIEEFAAREGLPGDVVQVEVSGRAVILFDRLHLHQILWNLVSNALRYSRRETGSVRLRVLSHEHDPCIDIHVIDDGDGIDETHREQIFEPFFTTHSRGTGLGLYIARELCEANGARLELLDNPAGANFCITIRSVE